MVTDVINVQHIQGLLKPTPEGYAAIRGVSIEWRSNLVLDVGVATAYDNITIKKGDKELTLPWCELAKRLGMDW